MTFHQLLKEDYAFKAYELFKSQLAFYGKEPIKVVRVSNPNNVRFIFILKSTRPNQNISTKQFTMSKVDAVFFASFVSNDFPNLDFEEIKTEIRERDI